MTRIYLFLLSAMLLLAGCDYFPGTVGDKAGVSKCYIEEQPYFMENDLNIQCSSELKCSAKMGFGFIRFDTTGCLYCKAGCLYYDYKYSFVQGNRRETINIGSYADLDIDSDEHIRFSLIDKANVEKKYDLDLSKIIHSYKKSGDSIVVSPPYQDVEVYAVCEDCAENRRFCEESRLSFFDRNLEIEKNAFGGDVCLHYYKLYYDLSGQSSLGTDSLSIIATIYVQ